MLPLPLVMPVPDPEHGRVRLRAFRADDVPMLRDTSTDPHVPLIGTLPGNADAQDALAYIDRQHSRLVGGAGWSFCIADAATDAGVGQIGLWIGAIEHGRATVGYSTAPRFRRRGYTADALAALVEFAWTIDGLHRLEAYIEPWNAGSASTARAGGFEFEGTLRSHQEIDGRRRDMQLWAIVRDS